MGGTPSEADALVELETVRSLLIEKCQYQNEKNWVASVSAMNRISLSKVLFYDDIVRRITHIPGVVMELGVQWGALTSLLYNLTAIHEPYNFRRRVVGFDTFSGFPESSLSESEVAQGWKPNDLAADVDAKALAERCLTAHQAFSGMNHMLRHEYVQGDVIETLPAWFESNPAETVALCVFDMDLGVPTRAALEVVLTRAQKGTVLVFDEYSHPRFPDEGVVVRDMLDTMNLQPMKSELLPYTSFIVL
jgi:hypothetical protein